MKKRSAESVLSECSEEGHARHSDAYRWLWKNYDGVKALLADHRPSWATIAAKVASAGVRGIHGQALPGNDLRRTWKKVVREREIVVAGKHGQVPARKVPAHVPATWQPERADSSSGRSVAPIDPEESSLVGLRRIMAERSGR